MQNGEHAKGAVTEVSNSSRTPRTTWLGRHAEVPRQAATWFRARRTYRTDAANACETPTEQGESADRTDWPLKISPINLEHFIICFIFL